MLSAFYINRDRGEFVILYTMVLWKLVSYLKVELKDTSDTYLYDHPEYTPTFDYGNYFFVILFSFGVSL